MPAVATAIVSDLHLGATSGVDVARRERPLSRLLETLAGADRIVFLGDLLELRERPAAAVLEDVLPVLRRIGEATAGSRVAIVPGNHDHQLVAPALERARLAGDGALPLQTLHEPRPGELAQVLAEAMPQSEVALAYPGIWLRDDVYATHGHYLDVHLTVPRVECLVAAAVRRYAAGLAADEPSAPEHYEAILGPIYALAGAVAQNARGGGGRGGDASRRVWSAANARGGAGARLRAALVGRAAIPAAVAAINAAGFGPFTADLSGSELRRAGLLAIGEVVARLGIDAEHVIFGHTHRAGPLDGELDGWLLPGGGRLTNCGSWVHERVFVARAGSSSPYWPGGVVLLGESGPPRLRNVLGDIEPTADAG